MCSMHPLSSLSFNSSLGKIQSVHAILKLYGSNLLTKTQGIYIGQTFFPMVHLPENSIHEIYLRAASAKKKNAPLKLHANVVGKLTVEQREISNELRDKIRESTQDAVAQKSSRATVVINTPPDSRTISKKRKEPSSSMFRRPICPSVKVKTIPVAPSSTPPSGKSSLLTAPLTYQDGVPLRKRLVHCLAKGEKSEEELFKLLGASDRNSSLRPEIIDLLERVSFYETKIQMAGQTGWFYSSEIVKPLRTNLQRYIN